MFTLKYCEKQNEQSGQMIPVETRTRYLFTQPNTCAVSPV